MNSIADAYIFPSEHQGSLIEKYDDAFKSLINSLGINNGILNVQGFVRKDGSMVFFEAGFRLSGTKTFLFTEYINSVSAAKMLISHSLTGHTCDEALLEDATFKGKKACLFCLSVRDGIIARQEGVEKAHSLTDVIYSYFTHPIGEKIILDGTQFPMANYTYIVSDTYEKVKLNIEIIKNIIRIYDKNGHDMVLRDFDTDRITM